MQLRLSSVQAIKEVPEKHFHTDDDLQAVRQWLHNQPTEFYVT